jgi:hypothetical protein
MPLQVQAHLVTLVLLAKVATTACATFGPKNEPPDLWSALDAVGAAVWQAGATTDGVLRSASADRVHVATCAWNGPRQRIRVDRLRRTPRRTPCHVSHRTTARRESNGHTSTGVYVLVTDFPTPYLPTAFSYGTACPTTLLVIITLV